MLVSSFALLTEFQVGSNLSMEGPASRSREFSLTCFWRGSSANPVLRRFYCVPLSIYCLNRLWQRPVDITAMIWSKLLGCTLTATGSTTLSKAQTVIGTLVSYLNTRVQGFWSEAHL